MATFLKQIKAYKGPRGIRLEASPDGEQMTLSLYGVCGRRNAMFGGDFDAGEVSAKLAECGGKPLTLRLNSPGGDAFEGLAIHNLLAEYDGEVTAKIDAAAFSAASVIAMAADKISMGAGAQIMIHCAWLFAEGNSEQLRKLSDDLAKTDQALAGIYARRMGASVDEVMTLMRAESYFSGSEALAAKLADESADDMPKDEDDEEEAPMSEEEAPMSEEAPPVEDDEEPEEEAPPAAVKRSAKAAKADRERLIDSHAARLTARQLATVRGLATLSEVRAALAVLPGLPRATSARAPTAPPVVDDVEITPADQILIDRRMHTKEEILAYKRAKKANL